MSVQMVGQLHPVLAERVNVWSGDGLVAKTANVSYAHIVHHNVKNVGSFMAVTNPFSPSFQSMAVILSRF